MKGAFRIAAGNAIYESVAKSAFCLIPFLGNRLSRFHVVFSLCAAFIAAPAARAQQTVIVGGIVVSAASEQSLPYSTVSAGAGMQRFTGADGSFTFELAPGKYSFRVRQLGFSPLDTAITVAAGANLRAMLFKLRPVSLRLDAVRTYATSCNPTGHDCDISGLLREPINNADREELLRTGSPFVH